MNWKLIVTLLPSLANNKTHIKKKYKNMISLLGNVFWIVFFLLTKKLTMAIFDFRACRPPPSLSPSSASTWHAEREREWQKKDEPLHPVQTHTHARTHPTNNIPINLSHFPLCSLCARAHTLVQTHLYKQFSNYPQLSKKRADKNRTQTHIQYAN